jgi:hypothetical protein
MISMILLSAFKAIISMFWDSMTNWIRYAVSKVQQLIKKAIIGFTVFVQKVRGLVKEISKHYSQNKNGRWEQTIVTREIDESEIPEEILAKVKRTTAEVDITHELQLQLT